MRKAIVAGNWKMNGNSESINELMGTLIASLQDLDAVEALVCPPAVYLSQVKSLIGNASIALGAQNASQFESGAYTGENSPGMLTDLGCQYVILGHSERRAIFGEKDADIAAKFNAAIDAGLVPILCVGETLEEREDERTMAVVGGQLKAVLDACGVESFAKAVIAYEPVWAIGTGKTATPEQAQDVHQSVRAIVAEYSAEVAAGVRILYGGSVNAANADELFANPDVDGGLVGGASLKPNDFIAICRAAAEA
ncbi:triose-phosphate isomerase [Pontibacterium sp. N1Y112]|uniref:Triosephosphate isomerase n=1 Tax=Pontibacterium sinense TaxID=2781979 RepID=A0A8J7K6Y5_9GAMM|nr:triose-phosphate isomerase [Pontibacterium sinense]MBE9399245.1 triose-phosphate isomerase [Pontibacterium sinense]